jgi:hypothetical protein
MAERNLSWNSLVISVRLWADRACSAALLKSSLSLFAQMLKSQSEPTSLQLKLLDIAHTSFFHQPF